MTDWTWTSYGLLTLGAAAILTGCPSAEDEPTGAEETEAADTDADEPDTDADEPGTDPDEPDTDADEPDTDGDEPDTDGDNTLPNDCSCYNPAIDIALDFDEDCLPVDEALPGCAIEEPPCDAIIESDGDSGGDAAVGPDEAITCLADRLAAGESPAFVLGWESFAGGDSTRYLPMGDGRYVTFHCGFFDNPPAYQSVSTYQIAGADYFAACLEDNPDDAVALFECMELGITDADDPMLACE